jgi:hypothetical protein
MDIGHIDGEVCTKPIARIGEKEVQGERAQKKAQH